MTASPTQPRTLIVGIGSPLRGDDALGFVLVAQLQDRIDDPAVEIVHSQTLTPEIASMMSEADLVIFADASAERAAGSFHCQRVQPDYSSSVSLVHFLTPGALLAWCENMYGRKPTTWLVTVGARSFGFGEPLNPEVQAQIPAMIACINQLLAQPVEA